jgi:hypothetical protein
VTANHCRVDVRRLIHEMDPHELVDRYFDCIRHGRLEGADLLHAELEHRSLAGIQIQASNSVPRGEIRVRTDCSP